MARELRYDEPLMVKLEPELKRWLKVEAAASGTDMSKMIRALIVAERERRERAPAHERARRGRRLVEHMTGRATGGMTTDEIMALTRGED
jgi:hypothetical protein